MKLILALILLFTTLGSQANTLYECRTEGYNMNGRYVFEIRAMVMESSEKRISVQKRSMRICDGLDEVGEPYGCGITKKKFLNEKYWQVFSKRYYCDELETTERSSEQFRMVICTQIRTDNKLPDLYTYSTKGESPILKSRAGSTGTKVDTVCDP